MPLPGPRIVANIIDTLVFFVPMLTFIYIIDPFLPLYTESMDASDQLAAYLLEFAIVTVPLFLYFALQESSLRRATVGKRAMSIRLEADEGNVWKRNILRSLIYELVYLVGFYGQAVFGIEQLSWHWWIPGLIIWTWFTMSLFIGDGRTPYDRWAGTRVVRAEEI